MNPSELDQEKLTDYVLDHLDDDSAWPELLEPDVVRRTRDALNVLRQDLNQLFQERKADPDRQRLHPKVRAKAVAKYRAWLADEYQPQIALITQRSVSVRDAVQRVHQAEGDAKRRSERQALNRLARAIQAHRLAYTVADESPASRDRELWSALADVRVPFGGELLSADEAFNRGLWTLDERDVAEPQPAGGAR